jgi:hypothetical protein
MVAADGVTPTAAIALTFTPLGATPVPLPACALPLLAGVGALRGRGAAPTGPSVAQAPTIMPPFGCSVWPVK